MPDLRWVATLDSSGVKRGASEISKVFQDIDNKAKSLMALGSGLFLVDKAKNFASQVSNVRGEMQKLEASYKTLLGSKEKADQLMAETIELAAKTPFDLQQVANGAKSLLAYGSSVEDLSDEIKMLGNIASGLNIPFNDMVMLFGTTRTQGIMFTQDLRQFIGRGIPLAEELAKQFGVTKDEVGDLVTAGKVGFNEMNKALKAMTVEGGKFYNLMEEQSKTIAGQISNLEDAIYQMFNNIGKQSEGVISGAISGVSFLVENYEAVGKAIGSLIAVYGTYKTAVIATNSIIKINSVLTKAQAISQTTLTAAQKIATVATHALNGAQKKLNATMAINPYALLATAVVALVVGIYKLVTAETELEKQQKVLNDEIANMKENIAKEEVEIDVMFSKLKMATQGTDEWNKARNAILDRYGDVLKNQNIEINNLNDIAKAYDAIKKNATASHAEQSRVQALVNSRTTFEATKAKAMSKLKTNIGELGLSNSATATIDAVLSGLMSDQGGDVETLRNLFLYKNGFKQSIPQVRANLNSYFEKALGNELITFNNHDISQMTTAVYDYVNAWKAYQTTTVDINEYFSQLGATPYGTAETSTQKDHSITVGQKIDELKKRIAEKEKALKKLKDTSSIYNKTEIERVESELKDDKELLKTLTGHDEKKKIEDITAETRRNATRIEQQIMWENQQLIITTQKKGAEQELAQMRLDHEKKMKEIEWEAEDEQTKLDKNYKDKSKKMSEQAYKEATKQIEAIKKSGQDNEETLFGFSTEQFYDNLIAGYANYEKQREAIQKKYAADRKVLTEKDTEEAKQALKVLNEEERKELEALAVSQREYAKNNNKVLKKAFGNTAITTKKQLEEAIGIVEKYRQILGADNEEDALKIGRALGLSDEDTKKVIANGAKVAEEIQEIDDKLNGLKSKRTGLKKIADDFKALAKSAKEGGLDFTKNLQAVLDFANGISNAVESIASHMNEIASISGDDKLARRAQSISNAVSVVNSTANGALRGAQLTGNGAGAVLGGVIGFSISLIEKSSKANAENAKRATEMTEALKEYYRTLESAKLDSMFKDSIFGSGGFSNAISRIKTLEEEWENLNNGEYRHNLNGKGYTVYDERIQQFNKFLHLYGSVFNLLDEKGNVIVENLRSLLDSGGVADNYKEGVEFALSYLEKIEEATNELNNELSNLFGSLGDNLAQSMFDAFAEGEDAGKAMFDTLDSLEKSFAKTIMKDFANKWLANNFGNDIDNIANMTSDEDVESSISALLLNIRSLLPNLETGFKTIYDSFGFSESMSASSSTAKGIAQASQDSVDELNGRFTAIQSHTYSINESIKDVQSRQATILNEIMGIHTDTSSLKTMFTNGTARVRLER